MSRLAEGTKVGDWTWSARLERAAKLTRARSSMTLDGAARSEPTQCAAARAACRPAGRNPSNAGR